MGDDGREWINEVGDVNEEENEWEDCESGKCGDEEVLDENGLDPELMRKGREEEVRYMVES